MIGSLLQYLGTKRASRVLQSGMTGELQGDWTSLLASALYRRNVRYSDNRFVCSEAL